MQLRLCVHVYACVCVCVYKCACLYCNIAGSASLVQQTMN